MKFENIDAAIAAGTLPINSVPGCLDLGLENLFEKKPEPPKELMAIEAMKVFTPSEAVRMSFIPQMLIALALDETTIFVNYCKEKRLIDFKKHNRIMRQSMEDYASRLRKSYMNAYAGYVSYVEQYFERVCVDRARMWFSLRNIAHRQLPEGTDHNVAVRIAMIHRLLDFAEAYDKKADKQIAERFGKPISRRQDKNIQTIIAACEAIENDFQLKLSSAQVDDLNMAIFGNRASALADEIMKEEDKCQ